MFEVYLLTLVGVALAQASPGPNLLAVAGAALGQGRKYALATVAGVSTGMLIWATAVAFGLAAVLEIYPMLLSTMKIVGGLYLLWIAIKAFNACRSGHVATISAQTEKAGVFKAWLRGILVVLTNPKAALMWAAVGTFLFGSGLEAWQVLAFGPVAAISATLIYGSYGLLFSTPTANSIYKRFARWIEGGFAAAFGVLGGRLLIDGFRELRT